MTTGSAFAGVIAAALMMGGLALLVLAWGRKRQGRGPLIAGGWALVAVSAWPWMIFGGLDRGLALAACVMTLAAFGVVLRNGAAAGRGKAAREDDEVVAGLGGDDAIPWLRRTWVVVLAGPVAFASAMALAMVVFLSPGMAEADRVTLGGLMIPLAWGILTTWALSDPKLVRKSVAVVGTGAVSALAVALLAAAQ